jgi:hypothetical protein
MSEGLPIKEEPWSTEQQLEDPILLPGGGLGVRSEPGIVVLATLAGWSYHVDLSGPDMPMCFNEGFCYPTCDAAIEAAWAARARRSEIVARLKASE